MPPGVNDSPYGGSGSTFFDIVISPRGHSSNSLHTPNPTSISSIIMGEVVQMHFTTVDYVIFALLLVASTGIGLFYAFSGGRQRTTQVEKKRFVSFLTILPLRPFCRVHFKFPRITTFEFVVSETDILFLPGVPDG